MLKRPLGEKQVFLDIDPVDGRFNVKKSLLVKKLHLVMEIWHGTFVMQLIDC